jgi:ribosomal protein L14E/L6E/L27E
MLSGRHAGKKAIVIKTYDDGSGDRKFPHAVGEQAVAAISVVHL